MNYLRDLEDYLEKKKVVHRGRTLGIPPAKMAMGYRPVGPGGHPAHRNSPAEIRDLNRVYLLPVLAGVSTWRSLSALLVLLPHLHRRFSAGKVSQSCRHITPGVIDVIAGKVVELYALLALVQEHGGIEYKVGGHLGF